MSKVAIVALHYYESSYQQTIDCLKATGLPIYYAHRDGVGNMSRAFNDAFDFYIKDNYEYVWFVTNVTFAPDLPIKLMEAIEQLGVSAIHPGIATSDHQHLWPGAKPTVVPFIEFMAPMFKAEVYDKYRLDENLWYYYMDLDISYRMNQDGLKVGCHNAAPIGHEYLRNIKPEPIGIIRGQLRTWQTVFAKKHMETKYGKEWKKEMQWKG